MVRSIVDASRAMMMNLLKIVVVVLLVLALSPLAGFWIVALVGAGLILLPLGAVMAKVFPETWKHLEHSLLPQTLRSAF